MEQLSSLKGEIGEKESLAQEQAKKEERIEVGAPTLRGRCQILSC